VHEDVREHSDRQRDRDVGQQLQRPNFVPSHQKLRTLLGDPRQRGLEPAELPHDPDEGNPAQNHEHQRLKRVDPGGATQPAVAHVGQHDGTHGQASQPLGQAALGDLAQRHPPAHHADQQVGHDERDQHDEQHQPQHVRVPALAEVLHLGDVAMLLAQGPQTRTHEVEDDRDDERR